MLLLSAPLADLFLPPSSSARPSLASFWATPPRSSGGPLLATLLPASPSALLSTSLPGKLQSTDDFAARFSGASSCSSPVPLTTTSHVLVNLQCPPYVCRSGGVYRHHMPDLPSLLRESTPSDPRSVPSGQAIEFAHSRFTGAAKGDTCCPRPLSAPPMKRARFLLPPTPTPTTLPPSAANMSKFRAIMKNW